MSLVVPRIRSCISLRKPSITATTMINTVTLRVTARSAATVMKREQIYL